MPLQSRPGGPRSSPKWCFGFDPKNRNWKGFPLGFLGVTLRIFKPDPNTTSLLVSWPEFFRKPFFIEKVFGIKAMHFWQLRYDLLRMDSMNRTWFLYKGLLCFWGESARRWWKNHRFQMNGSKTTSVFCVTWKHPTETQPFWNGFRRGSGHICYTKQPRNC